MGLFKHTFYKQLAKSIALLTFLINYIGLLVFEGYQDFLMTFAIYPSMSFFTALAVFIFIRLIYWVVDAYKKRNKYNKKANSE